MRARHNKRTQLSSETSRVALTGPCMQDEIERVQALSVTPIISLLGTSRGLHEAYFSQLLPPWILCTLDSNDAYAHVACMLA
jgi:hypothetical protein